MSDIKSMAELQQEYIQYIKDGGDKPLLEPKCEVCLNQTAISFSYFQDDQLGWKFCCECTSDSELYWIWTKDFHRETWWIDHLRDKNWFKISEFYEMMARYYHAKARVNHER